MNSSEMDTPRVSVRRKSALPSTVVRIAHTSAGWNDKSKIQRSIYSTASSSVVRRTRLRVGSMCPSYQAGSRRRASFCSCSHASCGGSCAHAHANRLPELRTCRRYQRITSARAHLRPVRTRRAHHERQAGEISHHHPGRAGRRARSSDRSSRKR